MNPSTYPSHSYPFYGYQVVPLGFPPPLFVPQYYSHPYPPILPSSSPNVMKGDENGLQLSSTEQNQKRSSKQSKHHKPHTRTGPWTVHEHKLFLEAMKKYGNDWPAVVAYVGTRSAPQVRSHAQKHYKRLRKSAIAKIKKDPRKKKAVFVITQEYRHHNRIYRAGHKAEEKKVFPANTYLQKSASSPPNTSIPY